MGVSAPPINDKLIQLSGGVFSMGSENHYPDEGPVKKVEVPGFWIDPMLVTNAQFAEFVDDTGHVTVAEVSPSPEQPTRHTTCAYSPSGEPNPGQTDTAS